MDSGIDVVCPILFQQQHSVSLSHSACGEPVEVHAAGDFSTAVIPASPCHGVGAGFLFALHQRCDPLTSQVEDLQRRRPGFGQAVGDLSRRIEWVGHVLRDLVGHRQIRCDLRHTGRQFTPQTDSEDGSTGAGEVGSLATIGEAEAEAGGTVLHSEGVAGGDAVPLVGRR